jgi:hypothetical protein
MRHAAAGRLWPDGFVVAGNRAAQCARHAGVFAAGLLCLSPVFFSQAMLAQLDEPAMLFTALALLLFVQNRIVPAAAACVALVLVKETGVVAPLVFGLWLAREQRWRDAAWFLAPVAVLCVWIGVLAGVTGHWAGNAAFARYNLYYPLHPVRLAVDFLRRIYYLFFANFHFVGAFAILFAWRTSAIFRSRAWRVAWALLAAHVATALGGAVLERYLLPVLPVLYAAMAAGLSLFPRTPRLVYSAALLAGVQREFSSTRRTLSLTKTPWHSPISCACNRRRPTTSSTGIRQRASPRSGRRLWNYRGRSSATSIAALPSSRCRTSRRQPWSR